jgi:hypothetical protein
MKLPPLLAARPVLFALPAVLVALAVAPAQAQDEGSEAPEHSESEGPASALPASDSPESTASIRVLKPQWQGARKKIQTFLVPLDEKARAPTARVAQALEALQGSLAQYEVVDLGRALSVSATSEQEGHAAEGRKLLAEGNLLFAGRGYADAAQKYVAAIRQMEKGLAAIEAREYAEAWARLGAVEALSGDEKTSRVAFVSAARHDPERKIQGRSIDASAETRLLGARAEVEALPSGTVEFETKPVGARVLVDGEQKGQAPLRVELTAGKHLVRLERAGYFPSAEMFEVPAGKESLYQISLKSTPRAADLYEVMAAAADEAARGEVGAGSQRLAEKFGLDRIFVGSVAAHASKIALVLALVDVQKHRQIGKASLILAADGTDADQLEEETRTAAKKLAVQDPGDAPPPDALPQAAAGPARTDGAAEGRQTAVPVDEMGLAAREKRPAPPAETAAAQQPSAQPPAEEKKAEQPKKKRPKKLKDVTGTEGWDD